MSLFCPETIPGSQPRKIREHELDLVRVALGTQPRLPKATKVQCCWAWVFSENQNGGLKKMHSQDHSHHKIQQEKSMNIFELIFLSPKCIRTKMGFPELTEFPY